MKPVVLFVTDVRAVLQNSNVYHGKVYISKRYIENIGLLSSIWSVYPESFSKYKILSWFVDQTSDLEVFFKVCFTANFLLLLVAAIGFFCLFIILQKNTFLLEKVLPFFKNLSFRQKIFFCSFTLFIAIPHKFWINNKIHRVWVVILSFIIYLMGHVYPILLVCYVMYMVLCLENAMFGLLYEKFDYFRRCVNWVIFGASEEPFALEYFEWFWGNMFRAAIQKGTTVGVAALALEAERTRENYLKVAYADRQTELAARTNRGFETPQDRANFHTARRNEWVAENGTVTFLIEKLKAIFG